MSGELRIQQTPPQRHLAALELLFGSLAASECAAQVATTLAALRDGRLTTDGLFEARRGERLVGAVWASGSGGKTALVWTPQLVAGEAESTVAALLEAIDAWMRRGDLQIANAFLTDDQSPDARRLLAGGYQRLAEIVYLVSEAETFPDSVESPPLTMVAYDERDAARMTAIVEATYEGTLDCPQLNGMQSTADVLAGYRTMGDFRPDLWLLAREGENDVGCLLLADHPADEQLELVYQGVVPSARGQGWGYRLTRHAQWLTRQTGRKRLVLAVDAANQPALRIYREAGFQEWDRRFLLLKQVGRSQRT